MKLRLDCFVEHNLIIKFDFKIAMQNWYTKIIYNKISMLSAKIKQANSN